MQTNKLKKMLIKKIIVSFFIMNLAVITTNSFCMLTVFARSASKSSIIQSRGFGSVPILSQKRYNALRKQIEEDNQRLCRLNQNFHVNPNAIDIVRRRIDRNRRILNTCQIISPIDPSDDIN